MPENFTRQVESAATHGLIKCTIYILQSVLVVSFAVACVYTNMHYPDMALEP
jgi:hypothetical protein